MTKLTKLLICGGSLIVGGTAMTLAGSDLGLIGCFLGGLLLGRAVRLWDSGENL
jgi:hypothetical protein